MCLLAEPVDAQPAPRPAADDSPQMRVAASENRLWRAHIESGRSLVSYRDVTGPFQPGEPFDATIVSLTAGRRDLYAFCDDGSFWRYSDGWATAVDLPDRQRPLHLLDVNGVLYGVVASAVAAQLPHSNLGETTPTTRPFDPGDAPLSIVRGDSRSWAAIAPCPVVVNDGPPPGLTPRLCHAGGHLMLFWRLPDSHQITYARLDPGAGKWLHSGTTIGVPRLTAFWIPVVNRRPTLVAVKARKGGGEELVTFRLLAGHGGPGEDSWQPAEIELSALPEDVAQVHYAQASGFNQHLGVLVTTADGPAFVRFGHSSDPSALSTINLLEDDRPEPAPIAGFPTLRAVVLLGILAMLLAFRRGAIFTPLELPEGRRLAFTMQRLAGCAIDLLPFSLAAALILRINWFAAFPQLLRWALEPRINDSGLPDAPIVYWWCLSLGGYALYSLAMELLTRRTVGKVLMRVELLSEAGTPPAAWQIVVRNLFRLVELIPPFWILGFLVVLSRNRQRVGDIFARTIAVRRAPVPADNDDSADT